MAFNTGTRKRKFDFDAIAAGNSSKIVRELVSFTWNRNDVGPTTVQIATMDFIFPLKRPCKLVGILSNALSYTNGTDIRRCSDGLASLAIAGGNATIIPPVEVVAASGLPAAGISNASSGSVGFLFPPSMLQVLEIYPGIDLVPNEQYTASLVCTIPNPPGVGVPFQFDWQLTFCLQWEDNFVRV